MGGQTAKDFPGIPVRVLGGTWRAGAVRGHRGRRADRIDPVLAPEGVRWLAAEPGAGVPRLRRLGLDAARAPVVAFTEDSCRLGPGWVEAWLQAFRDPLVPAATGPVAPAMGDSALDWAVFFCEYAPFLPSGREGVGPPEPPGREQLRHPPRPPGRA